MARLRDHRLWMMGIGFAALLLTGVMFMVIPQQFFPDTDNDFSTITIDMVPGTTIEQTEQKVDEVLALVKDQPDLGVALERIREGNGRVFLNWKDRKESSLVLERKLTPVLQQVSDARVNFQSQNGGGPGGGSGRPISVMLSGSDPELLQKTAQTLVEQMSGLKEVVAPRISADLRRPEIVITPHMDLAASLGVTTQALSQVIRIATQGEIDQNSAKFSLSDRQVPIRVKLPVLSRRDLSTYENLPVPTASGGSVPLARVATISFGPAPPRSSATTRTAASSLARTCRQAWSRARPTRRSRTCRSCATCRRACPTPAGEDRWQQEMLNNFFVALAAGVLLVFSVLVLLYRRFISPLVNMGSLFLAPLGGLLLLLVLGQSQSLPVFIGILMLFGIVAKNSILLIDFAIEEMEAGTPKLAAILEAGHKRAQPIVMTTVAMVAGMVPTAISLGGDGGWRAPMGTVVIGGLTLSTLLTLLIVPAGFSLADGVEKRIGPWLGRRVLTYDPHDPRHKTADGALPAE
jgi:multidrug efflux pump subunit AcrB